MESILSRSAGAVIAHVLRKKAVSGILDDHDCQARIGYVQYFYPHCTLAERTLVNVALERSSG